MSCSDRDKIKNFSTFLMKLGFRTPFRFYFLGKRLENFEIFSTFFATIILVGSHMVHIGEKCA